MNLKEIGYDLVQMAELSVGGGANSMASVNLRQLPSLIKAPMEYGVYRAFYRLGINQLMPEADVYLNPDIKRQLKDPGEFANEYVCQRILDWEEMLSDFEVHGGESTGEIWRLMMAFRESVRCDKAGRVSYDSRLAMVLEKFIRLHAKFFNNEKYQNADSFAASIAFYRMSLKAAKDVPNLVSQQDREDYLNNHLPGFVMDNQKLSGAIIADKLTLQFDELDVQMKRDCLSELSRRVEGLGEEKCIEEELIGFDASSAKGKSTIIKKAEDALTRLSSEMEVHDRETEMLRILCKYLPLVHEDSFKTSLPRVLIGNLVMGLTGKGQDREMTGRRYLGNSLGYFGDDVGEGHEILTYKGTIKSSEVVQILKNIFSSDAGRSSNDMLWNEATRIIPEASKLLKYMAGDEHENTEVSRIVGILNGDRQTIALEILKRCGPLCDQDPNFVNPFSRKGGLTQAINQARLYVVFDFIEGVKTQLSSENILKKAERSLVNGSSLVMEDKFSEEQLKEAVDKTIKLMGERIKELDNEQDFDRSLKSTQEWVELVFLRHVDGMKFVRWKSHWDALQTVLRVNSRCGCLWRKTLANPGVIYQY